MCETPDKKEREATGDGLGLSPRANMPEGSFRPVQFDPRRADWELDRRPIWLVPKFNSPADEGFFGREYL
jgi:hypothetical protein